MLDKQDLQAIAELIHSEVAASEERTAAKISEVRQEVAASEQRMKAYIDAKATEATSHAISYFELEVRKRLDVIKEGLDLALELPRVSEERVENIEIQITAIKARVKRHSEEIAALQAAK